ncbi:MAG: IS4 family transposase [Desulfobacula sp.]|nr:IS4 family transposase [Desulfobacula sp.]
MEPSWSEEEFRDIKFADKRLDSRFQSVAKTLSNQPQAPINQACDDWSDTKATYRFFNNEKVTTDLILTPHQIRTQERMACYPVVLSIQDTTLLDYSSHIKTLGLGPIGTEAQNMRGLVNHTTLVTTTQGLPLGVLAQEIWARDENEGSAKDRKKLPVEDKESYKWIKALQEVNRLKPQGVEVINVCDRESDVYEYFQEANKLGEKILLRSTQNRSLMGEQKCLWDFMVERPVAGYLEVEVSPKENQPARTATVDIRFGSVTLKPPYRSKGQVKEVLEPIDIDAVWVKEINAPSGVEALDWKLLTNVSVKNIEDAIERVDWYKKRWNIETYFKVLKSGCKIEDCRFETSERLIRYITLMSIIAWRLFWMVQINRTNPEAPCTVVLCEHEWKALYSAIHRTRELPNQVPTVREVIHWIAKLGGFLGRKQDKEPGITTVWRGWQRLNDIAATWLLFHPNTYG